jgi:hypothetical protein
VALLAEVDQSMGTLSGPAPAWVLRRASQEYGDARDERLASVSVAHLYNLRNCAPNRAKRVSHTHTRPVKAVTIGARKAPAPDGRPGFVRIDSVHQGIKMAPKACTTSTRLTVSPSGKSSPAWKPSARRTCCR